ncbi:PREDICTED: DDB1- and CUL4-associated factor homolog 1-like isoform X1 [Lupinus angustifolius]|uniref:DDB1- and CUL4-associated factor homolog 1-like isoform X1 n=1 Tax=Lupinus angustifolius TaxID=3871 RepID=UPI00092E9D25|nr:PREDICTED: DDB1- and CUL4-associated factor homolog 1-like isoform X1 [Lupinus angustifolius]
MDMENEPNHETEEQAELQEHDQEEEEELVAKVNKLMDKITSSIDNPKPTVLHALASILENQESRYMEENDHFSSSNGRAAHNIGRLGSIIRENDEFFELISSKFLSETRYSTSVQVASARLLLSCSLSWIYPHVFEEPVIENIRDWVVNDNARVSAEDQSMKHHPRKKEVSDSEMLKTYSTGLLAVCLIGGGQVVEDVLTSGLPAKLMRYLRLRVLGETSSTQKDIGHSSESRHASGNTSLRGRDDGRSRFRQLPESSHLDDTRMTDERSLEDQILERGPDRNIGEQNCQNNSLVGGEPPDELGEDGDICDVDADGEDRWHCRDTHDGRTKSSEHDDNVNDSSRRRSKWGRSRGKARVNESTVESEPVLSSPGSGSRLGQGRSVQDRSISRNVGARRVPDSKKTFARATTEASLLERDDNDDCFKECQIGSKDISVFVRKAVRASEAEARSANAPEEAVKAAGDAAADLVKTAASEEFKSTNDEEAAVLAASRAAATVVDAASAVEASSRSSIGINSETENVSCRETDSGEDVEDYFIPDAQSLAMLREKYCIQCLELLGEYVEVLGPVLHEKGVDVCLALLQQNSKNQEASKVALLLPDVMKLICALAAHRKFAALFVDRGGIQKLLAVPRMIQTFFGLSSCLFTIGSLQGIMERVCALPSDVVYHVVELALQLIECNQDQARKNAALFFAAAFIFRAVLDAFDSQDGLQKLLGLLNDAALVRSGVNSGALGLSNTGSLRNDLSSAEVLTSSEKQVAYHTCVALRQYFRAHLLLLVDSIRPNKSNRSAARNIPSVRAVYKPLDISNEAIDAVFLQLQKDRKLGPAFVRTRWPPVEKFLASNGHITMLELCQAPPVERYLHDLLQYALGVLHVVTLVPSSRKMIVNTTLSNNRVGIAVILDAANIVGSHVDPEIIQPALNVLVNLVCPPPSISNKPTVVMQVQQFSSAQITNGPHSESRDRTAQASQFDPRERNVETSAVDRSSAAVSTQNVNSNPQTPGPSATSGLVGDRRISLGVGAGCAGLAAQLEQGYRQSREAVRSNNGIKVLLHLLQPRIYSPPAALDCLRALSCRVLLGLARDDTIAQILTKLQVGKKLSELIRDSSSQTLGTEQGRWQVELSQAAIELIGIVTNSGRASTLAATDAATPTLRRIERAAIAAATPITYHARELLLLVHEHLQASGLSQTASLLLKEAQLTPLPSLMAPFSLAQQPNTQEASSIQIHWPSGRAPAGFLTNKLKVNARDEDTTLKIDPVSAKKKSLTFSASFGTHSRHQHFDSPQSSGRKWLGTGKESSEASIVETPESSLKHSSDAVFKTPMLPLKRKLSDVKDIGMLSSSGKRLNVGDQGLRSPICSSAIRKSSLKTDAVGFFTPISSLRSQQNRCTADHVDDNQYSNSNPGQMTPSCQVFSDIQLNNPERITLDSLVVQSLKHQHRQCPAPITTLPPLSLLHPHVCPEPKQSLDAPSNVTARLGTREYKFMNGGVHGNRRDRHFVYSRFRPWRTCRDDAGDLLTCVTFVGDSSHIAVGNHNGELKFFDSNNSSVVESFTGHQNPLTLVQSFVSGDNQLLLSSSSQDVMLWDATSILSGPTHSFEGCKAARFSNSGNVFAALSSESARREILLYDIQTCQLELKLSDTPEASIGRTHVYSLIHFSPSDSMLLWNGVLWDRRVSGPVHRFEQLTDYGGGGFHPAGNEVIINSEVWDLRKFRLQRSVPSLDQTSITFNARGDVMYAILRRNLEDVMSAVHNTRRGKHPLFAAFRTLDAINYSDIATIPVDRCVLDFASEPTDSFVGLVTMDDQDEMYASARIYEIGRRRPTDDDSDPDDAESEEEDEDDEDDDDIDIDPLLGPGFAVGSESDADDTSNDEDDDSISDIGEDGDFILDDVDFDGGNDMLEIVTEGDEDDDSQGYESLSSDEEDYVNNRNRFGY